MLSYVFIDFGGPTRKPYSLCEAWEAWWVLSYLFTDLGGPTRKPESARLGRLPCSKSLHLKLGKIAGCLLTSSDISVVLLENLRLRGLEG